MSVTNSKVQLELALALLLFVVPLSLTGCEIAVVGANEGKHGGKHTAAEHSAEHEADHHARKIIVTSPLKKDVISTQPYVCQIHSCQHIEIKALEGGYLQDIPVKEGQAVKKGELLFQILPTLYQARLASEEAEAQRAQIELDNSLKLMGKKYVSDQEVALKKAAVARAQAQVMLAKAELNFASVVAPFDGIVDRQQNQVGSLIEEGDVLTTFSDNSLMWVYFNVPEKRYLEYKEELNKGNSETHNLQIELELANGQKFAEPGKIGAIEADFNNRTGNISFRADFPNPDGLLRNGQTGKILIHSAVKDAVVIPQRAVFYILDKSYVYVVGDDHVVRQRDVTTDREQDDIFVISEGLKEGDKIILEGIRQVRDGDKIEYDFQSPEEALRNLKYHAE